MKNLFPLLLSAVFCWLFFSDCNLSSGNTNGSGSGIDTTAQAGTIIVGGDTLSDVTKTVPVEKDQATKDGETTRKTSSVVAKEDCCAGTEPIKSCCCDIVAKKYSSALSTKDYAFAAKLKSTDPYFAACKIQIPEFEKAIIKADSIYLGN